MIKEIIKYNPQDPFEVSDKLYMIELFEEYGEKLFSRFKFFHFSASGIIFNKDYTKVLFIYHKIYNSWSWLGGHMDGETDFLEVALREMKEESGLKNVKPIKITPVSIEILPVWFHFKNDEALSSHQHLNVSYAFVADETEQLIVNKEETKGAKWILIEDLEKYVSEEQMLPVYNKIINRVQKWKNW